jgi:hypothetical protein
MTSTVHRFPAVSSEARHCEIQDAEFQQTMTIETSIDLSVGTLA